MKKSIFTALVAAMVLTMSSITAFAASPTVAGTVESAVSTQTATTSVDAVATPEVYSATTTVSEGYTEKAVSTTTVQSAAVAAQNIVLNDLATLGKTVGSSALVSAATDSSKKVTATVRSVVDVSPTTATKNAAGKYVVTLTSQYLGNGTIVALHYNGSGWEPILPSSVSGKSVTLELTSLSPIALVEVNVASTAVATSPKTGETYPAAMAVILFGLAGAVICGKKVFA